MVTLEQQLFTEVFPVDLATLPELCAYRVQMQGGEPTRIGGKLTYRLRRLFPGHWVWAGGRIITDTPPNPVKLLMTIDTLVKEQPAAYKKLASVEIDAAWQPTPEVIADFVVRGPLETLGDTLREALAKTAFQLRNAHVEREHRIRAWVVDGQPAVSFSVVSHLVYDHDLATFAAQLEKQNELIGVRVSDKFGTMQGEIVKVVGTLAEHRERLLNLTQREVMRELLRAAPDEDLVVRVVSGSNEYDYAGSALRILLRLDDARRFDVNPQQAARALRLKPGVRAQMVKIIADIAKAQKVVTNAFSTQNAPEPFNVTMPEAEIVFGSNRTRPYDVEKLPEDFTTFGAYWWRERFKTEPVRVGVINTLSEGVDDFLEALRRMVKSQYGFQFDVIRERKVRVVSQSNLESAVRVFQKEAVDLILAFFENESDDDDDEGATGQYIKSQTIGRGLPCLVIHESTMHKPEAMPNLVIGIIGRAGNVPYLLDDPLPYTDYVVGLDLIRHHKKEGDTVTGLSRIYRNDGALLTYCIESAVVKEGEGIPAAVLSSLFPLDLLGGQRVVIHNNGRLRREELRALGEWEAELDAIFLPVEIMRHDIPRLYALEAGKISRPPWGTAFKLNDLEAFVVTSAAPADATPHPLHVRIEPPLTIDQALHSVTMFTLLHYGALKTPKLPVTVHHAEHIRASVLRGVLPDIHQGDVPFWL